MGNILHTEGLTKSYGRKKVVNDITMNIDRGDIYGFIGRNGAGKTTFMRLVLGLAIPDKGSITLFEGMERHRAGLKMGSIIEAPALYEGCTALENLKRFSIISGRKGECENDAKLNGLIEMVGLKEAGAKKVGHFSLGMKQRLGLAVAMLGDPEFLIMDEPVNGLDPSGIKDIRDAIINLNREKNITFLISSHLLDELSRIVTRYGIINEGTLIEEITAKELEDSFRKNITVTVDDTAKAKELLGGFIRQEDLAVHENNVVIYSHDHDPAYINRLLVTGGVSVSGLSVQSRSIEDYFIERIGG